MSRFFFLPSKFCLFGCVGICVYASAVRLLCMDPNVNFFFVSLDNFCFSLPSLFRILGSQSPQHCSPAHLVSRFCQPRPKSSYRGYRRE
eukprot:m.158958 g.158958  ORF g.158958 m.158958 type:complete len:89 (-) comp24775_c0_seq7:553-819(-)